MKVSPRGRFKTIVHDDGSPILISVTTKLLAVPQDRNSQKYARVQNGDPLFDRVDAEIRKAQPDIEFSPVTSSGVIVKIGPRGLIDPDLHTGDDVDVHARLGNFGKFGYCWVATHIIKTLAAS
jgi:hypothetical protein